MGKSIVGTNFNDILGELDACALAEQIAKGEVSALEVTEAAIARAEALNPQLNAIVAKGYELALARAKKPVAGVFSGVPTFIKDTDTVAGLPSTMGSWAVPGKPNATSSPMVQQFEGLGLNILGISTMSEFGLTGCAETERYGATRNPWDLDHSTGGSSGGAGALVAAGVVPIAHGNDGAGSIRIPASCCGLVGLKPTQGRLKTLELPPIFPVNIFHQGILTRSVRDTAKFYEGLERGHSAAKIPKIGAVTQPGERRLRIGVWVDDPQFDSQCVSASRDAAALCSELGHHVEEISNPFPDGVQEDFFALWAAAPYFTASWMFGKSLMGRDFQRDKIGTLGRYLATFFRKRLLQWPFIFRRLKKFAARYDTQIMGDYDVFLMPTLAAPPPKIGYLAPDIDPEIHMDRLWNWIPYNFYPNISMAPAISLPLGKSTGGLPLGVQFSSKHGQDRLLLELAYELEQATPWSY